MNERADLVYRSFGGLSLTFRQSDNFVNVTALSKRYHEKTGTRRNVNDWLRLRRTQETINYIASIKGLQGGDLVKIAQGGRIPDEQGTFIHPDLVIPFATWLSVEFEYLVTQIVLQRMSDRSQDKTEEALRELINTLQVFFGETEEFGKAIHTNSHRQMERIRSGLELVKSHLETIQNENQQIEIGESAIQPTVEQVDENH